MCSCHIVEELTGEQCGGLVLYVAINLSSHDHRCIGSLLRRFGVSHPEEQAARPLTQALNKLFQSDERYKHCNQGMSPAVSSESCCTPLDHCAFVPLVDSLHRRFKGLLQVIVTLVVDPSVVDLQSSRRSRYRATPPSFPRLYPYVIFLQYLFCRARKSPSSQSQVSNQ